MRAAHLVALAARVTGVPNTFLVDCADAEKDVVAQHGEVSPSPAARWVACERAQREHQTVRFRQEGAGEGGERTAPVEIVAVPLGTPPGYVLCVATPEGALGDAEAEALRDLAALVSLDAPDRDASDHYDRLEALVRASAHIVVLAAGPGKMVEMTDRWEAITGRPREELANGTFFDAIHPDDRAAVVAAREQAIASGEEQSVRLRLHTKEGSYRWFEGQIVPVLEPDGRLRELVATLTDVHERYVAQARIQHNEERLRLALEASRIGMWQMEMETGDVFLSDEAYALLGVTRETFDRAVWEPFGYAHPADREALRHQARANRDAGFPELKMEYRLRPDATGAVRWVRSVSRAIRDETGTIVRLLGTIVDTTADKERELTLRLARDRAEEMLQLRNAFLANLSHEIRTPLTAVIGFSGVLREETPPDIHPYVDFIEASAQRLNDTLTSLLELSVLQAGARVIEKTTVDVLEVVRRCTMRYVHTAEQASIALSLHAATPTTTWHTDADAVRLIVDNLVSNAVKFTRRGAVRVTVAVEAEGATVRVEDTGQGIDPAFLPHVFDEFSQESTGLARSHEGVGLGLTVSHRLALRLGGHLAVESTVGEGSTFTLVLPARGEDSAAPHRQESLR